jgi:hypothetical protein
MPRSLQLAAVGHIYNLPAIDGDWGGAKFDKHGNPLGAAFDLAQDASFTGMQLLIGCFDKSSSLLRDIRLMVAPELKKKGWSVHITCSTGAFSEIINKEEFRVAWIISSPVFAGDAAAFLTEVKRFHAAGKGLMIWGENHPYYAEANVVLRDMFGFQLTGDTPGGHALVSGENPHLPGRFSRHLIVTGILHLFEGATICFPDHVPNGDGWSIYGTSTNKKPVLLAKEGKISTEYTSLAGRVVVDCGYTKLLRPWWAMAGTARYVSNSCAWLAWQENAVK